jgi:O-antigen/teichoic acid export membrane protein
MLGIYFNLAIWYKLTDNTRYGMYIAIIGAIITIAFNYIMIPIWGFMASAWATLITYATMTTISYFIGKKHYPVPYDVLRIGSYLLIASVFSAVSYLRFNDDYYISTILVLLFLGIIFLLEKREIKQFIIKK